MAKDHPRLRGKDKIIRRIIHQPPGSPPLTRERPNIMNCWVKKPRITPAYAGKTEMEICFRLKKGDHPRSRGKDQYLSMGNKQLEGSPPLARERHQPVKGLKQLIRITPACAGKTLLNCQLQTNHRDHPRSRGKDGWNSNDSIHRDRITPAHAGTTVAGVQAVSVLWDHHRSRGNDYPPLPS